MRSIKHGPAGQTTDGADLKRRDQVKKWLSIAVIVLVVGIGSAYAATGGFGQTAQSAQTPTPPPTVKASDKVVSDGKVVPVNSAALSLTTGGIVAKLNVAEGDKVQAGQTLLVLDNARQAAAVAQAEAGVKRAQAQVDLAKASARQQEIDQAKAGVDVAQANLARVRQGPTAADVNAAKAVLAQAQAKYDQTVKGVTPEELAVLERQLQIAKNQEYLAQQNAQEMSYRTNDGTSHSVQAPFYSQGIGDAQMGVAYEQRMLVEAQIASAKAPPTAEALAQLQAQVDQASAQVAKAQQGATPAEIAAAEAQVRQAQAQLGVVQAGPRTEAVAAAEADLLTAKAALDQAKVVLAETELKAPFAGNIASLSVTAGEQLIPGVAVARLADLATWQIETTDLNELTVNNVKVGDKATVTFDAIPDLDLTGQVVKVKSLGETKQGDIIYTVTVKPDKQDERLRWNMTASVTIEAKK
jgi:HlyD family secretion protein